jgi:hypothetical protein
VVLDPWQELVLRASMGERADGRWSAQQVALSAPRQNGKSQLIVARALAGALLFGERLIVISAHQQDTARETFAKLQEQIDASPALESRIAQVMTALNREFVKFKNGATIKFKARSGSGGRGFSSDCLMLDEAQILSARAWASIRPTMSARRNPQVWLLGTPPTPDDDGEVFGRIRSSALGGKTSRLAYVEWSADPEDDPALESTRAAANPAWTTRINHEIVQGEFESMSPEQFALERLGIWPDDVRRTIFPSWPSLVAEDVSMASHASVVLAVDVSSDLAYACVAAAGERDGLVDVRVDYHRGTGWVADRVVELRERYGECGPVWLVGRNAGALKDELEAAGVEVSVMSVADRIAGCAVLTAAVVGAPEQEIDGQTVEAREPYLRHGGQEPLDRAVAGARWSSSPDGRVLDRAHASADICPLYAVAGALYGVSVADEPLGDVLTTIY